MKIAVITDSSAFLPETVKVRKDLFVLDIPVYIDGQSYVEGKNLTASEFYFKMAQSKELPKTSQPSIADLEEILSNLHVQGYTHVIGLFLSSGISGFYQNIQYLKDEFDGMEVVFPDSKITSAPLGLLIENIFSWSENGVSFENILMNLNSQIEHTSAYILVDDLQHLVKGGRLSNGAAVLGNLLSIKPVLYFNEVGKIEVFEKVRTEKKAFKRLVDIIKDDTKNGHYQVIVIHGNAIDKAEMLRQLLVENGIEGTIQLATFGSVIGTHLGDHSVAVGYVPSV
ncbi:DegV family protein [Streptococcus sp. DD10]|uniref:DegV family protein n=1 Tax=Streptococcus sp. DD10 TaxID=1777878 RepID=UPI00079312EE|nr:DegV family protein [Streptococcus sp. DD10]KXT76427.1 DegV family protein [Streptococcus sp. DD10]